MDTIKIVKPETGENDHAFNNIEFNKMTQEEKDNYLKQPIKMYWEEQDG